MAAALGGSQDLLKRILGMLVEQHRSGMGALEAAVEAGDAEQVAFHAHSLKGAFVQVTQRNVPALLELERQAKAADLSDAASQLRAVAAEFAPLMQSIEAHLAE